MRRLLVAMSLALVASLALSEVAFATHSETGNGAGPPQDFAVGSGKVSNPFFAFSEVSLGAHSGPAGENPRGFIILRNAEPPQQGVPDAGKGHVVCLSVEDNRAVAVAEFKEESPFPGFPNALVMVEDNGEPNSPTPDRFWATGMAIDPEQITLQQ